VSVDASFLVGSTVRIPLAVRDITGQLADPGGLVLRIKPAGGTLQTMTYGAGADIVRDSMGMYHADILLSVPGVLRWRWEASAPNQGAFEGALNVDKSEVV